MSLFPKFQVSQEIAISAIPATEEAPSSDSSENSQQAIVRTTLVHRARAPVGHERRPQEGGWNRLPERPPDTPFDQSHLDAIHAGNAVPVWSSVWGEWLWWVRDEDARQKLLGQGCERPIYTLGELAVVAGMDTKALSDIHRLKVTLGGIIEPPEGDCQ